MNGLEYAVRSPVRQTVERASRRNLLVLAVEHSSVAFAVLFGGVALLLLFGTQILAWRWMLLVLGLGAATAYFRIRNHLLDRYRLAQLLDKRLASSDTLSTAWFLLEQPASADSVLAQAQIERAEDLARTVVPSAVFPVVWRRMWALTGALAALAFSLFALRYLVIHTLSLKPALVSLSFPLPMTAWERVEQLLKKDHVAAGSTATANNSGQLQEQSANQGRKEEQQNVPGDQAAGNRAEGKNSSGKGDKRSRTPNDQPNSAKASDNGDGQGNNSEKAESAKNNPPRVEKSSGDQAKDRENSSNRQNPNDAQEQSSGLMDRMKDALNGLMAKAQQQQNSSRNEQNSGKDTKPGEQSSRTGARNAQSDQDTRSSQDTDGENQQQSAQGQQQASEKSPGAQSKSSEQSSSQKGSDSQSGIGRQDGEKALKEAEQLRAMGKLDEIIGKRSASLTGEMTVETRSGTQQLQTQYTNRVGHHADLGGEIDRDEVPLALQRYVREYMEQVHKQAGNQ